MRSVLSVIFLLFLCTLNGQSSLDQSMFTPLGLQKAAEMRTSSKCIRCSFFNLNSGFRNRLLKEKPKKITIKVPTERSNKMVSVEFTKSEFLSDQFVINTSSGKRDIKYNPAIFYKAVTDTSVITLSLYKDEVRGMFRTRKASYSLFKQEKGVYGLSRDVSRSERYECEVLDAPKNTTKRPLRSNTDPDSTTNLVIGFEVNTQIYRQLDSSVTQVSNYVLDLFHEVSTLYAIDNITIELGEVYIWNTPGSPYDTINIPASSLYLHLFREHHEVQGGDLFHLLDYSVFTGGVAYLDVLCSDRFNVSFSGIYYALSEVPVYSWDVNVVAHELGHNIGSPHTHDCFWNGNNTQIDGCASPTGDCSALPTPTQKGTIMSYCHLTQNDNPGIDFTNGFHPQVDSYLKKKISEAWCLADTIDPPLCQPVDLLGHRVETANSDPFFMFNQDEGTAIFTSNYEVEVLGNSWKRIVYSNTVRNTYSDVILEFEFKSDFEGEFHGIALVVDNLFISDSVEVAKLYGTQELGDTTFNTYQSGDGWVRYEINWTDLNINSFNSNNILLITDSDDPLDSLSNSYFRNIKVYQVDDNCPTYVGSSDTTSLPSYTKVKIPVPEKYRTHQIEVYPNPAKDQMNIDLTGIEISNTNFLKVFNISGNFIYRYPFGYNENKIILDVSNFQTGMYFLQVETGEETFVKKFNVIKN